MKLTSGRVCGFSGEIPHTPGVEQTIPLYKLRSLFRYVKEGPAASPQRTARHPFPELARTPPGPSHGAGSSPHTRETDTRLKHQGSLWYSMSMRSSHLEKFTPYLKSPSPIKSDHMFLQLLVLTSLLSPPPHQPPKSASSSPKPYLERAKTLFSQIFTLVLSHHLLPFFFLL